MKRSTAALLILLRLAIGWHFLAEGWHKLHTHLTGPTESVTGKVQPWSSEGYFREGAGPLARLIRGWMRDPDDEALGRLVAVPVPEGQDPATYPPKKQVPPLLEADWQGYLDRFSAHYAISPEQRAEAQQRLEQAEAHLVACWLTRDTVDSGTKGVRKKFQSASYERKRSIPFRIAEYQARLREVRNLVTRDMPLLGKDVEGRRLLQAKAEVAELRNGLLRELDEQTRDYHDSLADLLTPEQKEAGPVPDPEPPWLLTWINRLTAWGLTLLGLFLVMGVFTRTSCVLAALFLLMTYLCTPPWLWMPTAPNSEGFYLFVNKNVVEMIALLALATTPSGRWFGIDAFLHDLARSFRARRQAGPSGPAAASPPA
jgi:uncharacterized membrane protein YphA (DoxX/SURF4 family)